MNQRWVSARHEVHKALIVLDQVGTVVGCDVRNGSRAGATLRLHKTAHVPSSFRLEMQGGENLICSVVRRSRIDISVRFEQP